jgi:hypothetical protein
LTPGTNQLSAYAVDAASNISTTNTVNFDYVATNQLQIRLSGRGTVSPNYSNAWLEIGKNYSITSAPAAGFAFTNWVISTNWIGALAVNGTNLLFMMQPNLTLQADFLDTNKPTLVITAPTAGQKMTNALAAVTGTAADNWMVSNVWYQLNAASWAPATTTNQFTNWFTTLMLPAGTNLLKAYAADPAGNYSATSSVSIVSSNTFLLELEFTNSAPLKANGLLFSLMVSTGLTGRIEVSTNLSSWNTLTNFNGSNGLLNFRDPGATNSARRFYRAVTP